MFTQSSSVYREKLGSRPIADEVINGDELKTVISTGKSVKENGNRFIEQTITAISYKQILKSIVEVMRKEGVPSATHNVYAYRFQGQDGTIHEGSDDDGEYGARRHLLKSLTGNEIKSMLVIVLRYFSWNKLGPRRFTHISKF